MKKQLKLTLLILTILLSSCEQGWNVKKGQIWIKEYNVDNPYEKVIRDTLVILETSGEYAKYIRNGEIESCEKFWVPVNARLLK